MSSPARQSVHQRKREWQVFSSVVDPVPNWIRIRNFVDPVFVLKEIIFLKSIFKTFFSELTIYPDPNSVHLNLQHWFFFYAMKLAVTIVALK